MTRLKLFVFCCLSFLTISFSETSGQLVFQTTAPSVIAYYEYLPSDYQNNSKKYPVVIFLHGIGERGPNTQDVNILADNIYKVAKLGPPNFVKNGTQFPFILIAPQLKNTYGTWPSWYVLEVINHVKKYLRIDERKIYLTGLSLGGGGAWVAAQDYPELFAALVPVCGGYNSPTKAGNIGGENLPVWASHGDKDVIVPFSKTTRMVTAINACLPAPTPLAKVTIYKGVGHNAWDYAYRTDNSLHTTNVYQWMMKKTNSRNAGNIIPIAKANVDQVKYLSSATTTNIFGSGYDADGTISSYSWTKLSGPDAALSNTSSAVLKVTGLHEGKYVFRLRVTDNSGNSDSDYVQVTVHK